MPGFGPLGSYPLGASGSGGTAITLDLADSLVGTAAAVDDLLARLTDGLSASDAPHAWIWPSIAEALTAGAAIDPKVLDNLIAGLAVRASIEGRFHLVGDASDSVGILGTTLAAWQLLLEEEVATLGAAVGTVTKIAALADALAATGQASNNLAAFASIVQAITMEGLIRTGFQPDLVDAATLASATDNTAKLLGAAAEGLLVSDAGLPMVRISAIAAEGLELASPADALLRANEDLADGILLYVTLRLGNTDYVGWALNTDALAASQYRTAPFDSYASFKGKDYAAGPDGLVVLGGDTDDGAAIEWSLKTFLMDFGTGKFKRVPAVYIGADTSGTLVVKVITIDPATGTKTEDWYKVARAPAGAPGNGYAKVGRGLKSTWWAFELVPQAGADLDGLDSISLRPLILDRRV